MKTSTQMIADLMAFFSDAAVWAKGSCAQDENGKSVNIMSDRAVKWDLYGRLYKMNKEENDSFVELHKAYKEIQEKMTDNPNGNTDLEYWNDKFDSVQDLVKFLNDGNDPTPPEPEIKTPVYIGGDPANLNSFWKRDGYDTATTYYTVAPDWKRVPIPFDVYRFYNEKGINFTGPGPINVRNRLLVNGVVTLNLLNGAPTGKFFRVASSHVGQIISFTEVATNEFGDTQGYEPSEVPVDLSTNFPVYVTRGIIGRQGEIGVFIGTSSSNKYPITEYKVQVKSVATDESTYHTFPGNGLFSIPKPAGGYRVALVESTSTYGKTNNPMPSTTPITTVT